MATSRGRCRPATANQEGEEEREADSKNQEVVETGRGDWVDVKKQLTAKWMYVFINQRQFQHFVLVILTTLLLFTPVLSH